MKSSILLQFRQLFFYSSGVRGLGFFVILGVNYDETSVALSKPPLLDDSLFSPCYLALANAFNGTFEVELMKLF